MNRGLFLEECFEFLSTLFEHPPNHSEMETWTDEELKAAVDWSMAVYLQRQPGNETMRVPRKPWFLAHYH